MNEKEVRGGVLDSTWCLDLLGGVGVRQYLQREERATLN